MPPATRPPTTRPTAATRRCRPRQAPRHGAAWLGLVAAVLAFALPPANAARPGHASAAKVPMRLPDSVVPQAVALHLQVDPDQPRHQGDVEIRVLLKQPVPAPGAIRLHAKDLQLQTIWLEAGAQRWRGTAARVDGERVDLRFNRPLPAGPAVLQIGFSGATTDRDVYGLFRQQEAGQWAAFTQFQATGARQAFPLFDEPGWKLPWTLSLTVPQALMAVSNMPVATEEAARPGFKRVTFQPTPPMPSYLLAFGVGRFAAVDAGRAGQDGAVPLRILVPAGREADAAFAAATTGRILDRLEDWFGMPHPFAKLDSLSVPLTTTFGAMEHAGLVTYASTLLLASPAERTPTFERNHVVTAAHELAHQWFGNLVTMAWWDDLWLNESFATWMEEKIADAVQPGWPWRNGLQRARARAMQADRLPSARHVEQPVRTDDDMGNLWDAITYEKGQLVLAMFEAWTGPEAFRDGVRAYLRRHAWGSATSSDFFQALSATDAALPAAVRSFTRQGGIPRLQVRLLCDGGPPRLQLAQSRLLPVGAPAVAPQVWQLPLRLRTPAGSTRLLMTTPEALLPLPDATCPAWVQANADGVGYWRTSHAGDGLQQLVQTADLPVAEWLALLDDGIGLHDAGDIDNRQLLALVRAAAAQPSGEVQQAAAALLRHLWPLLDADGSPGDQTAYAAAWQTAFGERARRLGWLPVPGDTTDDRLLRPELVPLVATLGADALLRQQALALAQGWLADRHSLPADLRLPVLAAAAQADGPGSGPALYQPLVAAWRASTERSERGDLLAALGQFRQPALAAQARALLLSPQVDLRDSLWPLLRGQAAHGSTRAGALDFVLQHQQALAARLGDTSVLRLPDAFSTACSDADARRLAAGLQTSLARVPGGPLALTRAVETVRLCAAWRARQGSRLPDPNKG